MRVLVTGGAGFIGSAIVDLLLEEGLEVAVVDNLSTGRRENVNPKSRLHVTDIRDPELAAVFAAQRPEVVFHQAARANVRESFQFPVDYADVNILGSLNLLECCRRFGVRKVVYASTGGAVYGEPRQLPVTEEHPVRPLDPYGASKHHVEHYLELYRNSYGLDYTILRYPNVFGARQDPNGEAGVIAIFIGRMLAGEAPTINGSGRQERDFVHVSDVAKANWLALERGSGQILNIGSGRGTSVEWISGCLKRLTGYLGAILHGPAKPGEVFRIFLDSTRAREVLGWQPRVPVEEGLQMTVEHFRGLRRG